jgi:hypothetical protein
MFKVLKFRFRVFFTKLSKGEYSSGYVNIFKDNDLRSPHVPCIKDEFIFHILMFLKKTKNVKILNTSENIQFGNTPFSLKFDEIFKLRGVPMCFNALNINDYNIKIIGYQDIINESKIKSIYFFVNNIFILGEYSFADNSITESIDISKIIINKYINESIENIDEFYIEDLNNNCIYFKDNGFERSVKYFNNVSNDSRKIYNELKDLMLPTIANNDEIESKLNELF